MTLTMHRLDGALLDDLASTLAAANLPIADLRAPGRTFFRFEEAGVVGYAGLEGDGPDRLLRSLVILPAWRRRGLGERAVVLIEREALAAGAIRLHLLTTTAADFFRSRGYHDARRDDAPRSIADSNEFSSLCPASALYLVKTLERSA